jgi:5'-3' exonuclease
MQPVLVWSLQKIIAYISWGQIRIDTTNRYVFEHLRFKANAPLQGKEICPIIIGICMAWFHIYFRSFNWYYSVHMAPEVISN